MGSIRMSQNGEPVLQYGDRYYAITVQFNSITTSKFKLNILYWYIKFTCQRCGRCKLQNVKVQNKGIDWTSPNNIYWKHDVQRLECLKIILHGNAEFEATDVVLQVQQAEQQQNPFGLLS